MCASVQYVAKIVLKSEVEEDIRTVRTEDSREGQGNVKENNRGTERKEGGEEDWGRGRQRERSIKEQQHGERGGRRGRWSGRSRKEQKQREGREIGGKEETDCEKRSRSNE